MRALNQTLVCTGKYFLFFLVILFPLIASSQSGRLQPGKMYDAGDTLFAPHFGFINTVPQGMSGSLPRESEVFLMTSLTKPVEIFVLATEKNTLEAIKAKWEKGIEMDVNFRLTSKNATIKDGVLSGEVVAVGPAIDKSKRGYAVARCSEFGPCVTGLALMAAQEYESGKSAVEQFMKAGTFQAPSSKSPYEKFDWRKFFYGKTLISYDLREKGSKENKIDLCADGTFTAKVDKKGILKNQNPAYRGRLSGVWTAEGIGDTGTLILQFKKLESLEVIMTIKDENIYANGERYFVGKSEKCK